MNKKKIGLRLFVRNFENYFSLFIVAFLIILPLLFKIMNRFHFQILNSENAIVNLVFAFACFSGIITWREGNHISLASLTDGLPKRFKPFILSFRSATTVTILTALFLASFSASFTAFLPSQKVWGIPYLVFFALLPLAYFTMLLRNLFQKEYRLQNLLGFFIGVLISLGPLSGVLYSLFKTESLGFLYRLNDYWLTFSAHAFIPLTLILVVFAFIGVPLFVILGGIAYLAFSQGGGYVEVLSFEAYAVLTDKAIAAIPLFTIAGFILSKGSTGKRLVSVFKSLFGWFKGGIVIAAVLVVTFFTIFTGASGVTILALGPLLVIALGGSGYKKEDSEALITASGAIGLLFPPSIAIIMFGSVNYFSVDVYDIFKGAFLPGLILAISMILLGLSRDVQKERDAFNGREILSALKSSVFEILLPFFVIFGFLGGFFSIIEAASFTLLYAFVLETFVRKTFSLRESLVVITEAIPITGGILFILASARGLSYFMIDANIPELITSFITSHIHSKILFLLLVNVFLLLAGCLMDIYSAIFIVSPLLMPICESFGIHPVHTAVIFLTNLQLGFLTPPIGMDLFVASYAFDSPVMKIVKNVLPFILVQAVVLLLITYIPWFTTVFL
ncbi:MAG TPA: TRAP transporter large permease subunit [Treponemataceae bacterium]|nr:TRAP transporter large permease subunit [Treponemataceae bacterium]